MPEFLVLWHRQAARCCYDVLCIPSGLTVPLQRVSSCHRKGGVLGCRFPIPGFQGCIIGHLWPSFPCWPTVEHGISVLSMCPPVKNICSSLAPLPLTRDPVAPVRADRPPGRPVLRPSLAFAVMVFCCSVQEQSGFPSFFRAFGGCVLARFGGGSRAREGPCNRARPASAARSRDTRRSGGPYGLEAPPGPDPRQEPPRKGGRFPPTSFDIPRQL